jgi:hypothetical protein
MSWKINWPEFTDKTFYIEARFPKLSTYFRISYANQDDPQGFPLYSPIIGSSTFRDQSLLSIDPVPLPSAKLFCETRLHSILRDKVIEYEYDLMFHLSNNQFI